MSHYKNVLRPGFTFVELMFAMAFLGSLMILISSTVLQITNIYHRGALIKQVTQTGRTVVTQMQSDVSNAAYFTPTSHLVTNSDGGRLCLGNYSYIWNYGSAIDSNDPQLNKYSDSSDNLYLVRIPDASSAYCHSNSSGSLPSVSKAASSDLLGGNANGLAVHKLTVSLDNYDNATEQGFYNFSLVLGTNDQDALSRGTSGSISSCKAPAESGSDQYYCAVNQFTFSAKTGSVGV